MIVIALLPLLYALYKMTEFFVEDRVRRNLERWETEAEQFRDEQ